MEINLNNKNIQDIKGHTKHKIKLVKSYVERWLEVASNAEISKSVCFIDGMCNAGIYSDGTLGTSTEVLKLFVKFAKMFPNIQYNIFCNDINVERIKIIKDVFDIKTEYKKYKNINVFIDNKDVNDYILDLLNRKKYFNYDAGAFTLLFLDPYNFGTVKLQNVMLFLRTYYSELMYNFFSSDIKRNACNEIAIDKKQKIINSMSGLSEYDNELDSNKIKQIIIKNIKNTQTKNCFTYQFKISTNVEIYNIIFASPKTDGIKKMKEVLWEVFDGDYNNYRLLKEEKNQIEQMTLFDDDYIKKDNLSYYSKEAMILLKEKYSGQEVAYKEIEDYLLCNTLLKSTQIINYVIKPMLKEGVLVKKNIVSNRNYTNDKFFFQ